MYSYKCKTASHPSYLSNPDKYAAIGDWMSFLFLAIGGSSLLVDVLEVAACEENCHVLRYLAGTRLR